MKTSNIVIGGVFILIGLIILLTNLDVVNINWRFVWQLWPALLVLIGLRSIFQGTGGLVISLLFTAAIIGGILYAGARIGEFSPQEIIQSTAEGNRQLFNVDYSNQIKTASLSIESGAGTFRIGSTDELLLQGEARSTIGEYKLTQQINNDDADLRFKLDNPGFNIGFGRQRHEFSVNLHTQPAWRIEANLGAAQGNLDFSALQTEQIDLKAGAADINMKLGDRSIESQVTVETGASSITVQVPRNAGVQIATESGLSGKDFNGFTDTGDGTYRTSNFDSAEKKIFLTLRGGVSSFKVERY